MLVRCKTLSTADADRTPSILICRLFRCSGSSTDVLERLMKLFLKFGGLTTLVAHFFTFRTLGKNSRVHKKTLRQNFLFFSLLFFSFLMQKSFLMPPYLSGIRCAHALSSLLFKMMQDASFQRFHHVRG